MNKRSSWLAVLAGLLGAVLAAADLEIPDLTRNTRAGDWVLYDVQNGIQIKREVVELTDTHLTLKIDTIMNGQALSSITQKIPRKMDQFAAPQDPVAVANAPKPVITKGQIEIKGKTLDCWIVEMTVQGQKSRTYLSQEVPVDGIVKTELNGQVSLRLVDFGRK